MQNTSRAVIVRGCKPAVRADSRREKMKTWPGTFARDITRAIVCAGRTVGRCRAVVWAIAAVCCASLCSQSFAAPAAPSEITVGAFVLSPFVMEQDSKLSGFSVDLWTDIAARLHVPYRYQVLSDVGTLFQTMRDGQTDIAVSGLFYSAQRDREFDFSYPIMEAGLRVMVADSGETAPVSPLHSLASQLVSRTTLIWGGVALLMTILAGHVVWLVERLQTSTGERGEAYFPGVFRATYWAATTLLSQGDQPPRRWIGRVLAVLWMFLGILFVASYTAQLASTLTIEHMHGAINGPDDLSGKRVATLKGGSAVADLVNRGATVVEYPKNSQVFDALVQGDVDAVVQGSAGLDYYATHEGKGRVKMVGPEFNVNDVGFVFPINSALRKRVDGALLSMREDGTYQRIYNKWFGSP
ncbi:transporter substrate-binding domain-containing protein [Pararobbsia silviterrae]